MNRLGRGYSFEALRAKILFAEGAQKIGKQRPKFQRQQSSRVPELSDDFLSCFQKLTALTEIAYLPENGMSVAATKSLLDMKQQATNLITRNK